MREFQELADRLIAHPLVAPPAIEDVVQRVHRARVRRRMQRASVAVGLLFVVSSARWMLANPTTDVTPNEVAGTEHEQPAHPVANQGSRAGSPSAACVRNENGGRTDVGVTARNINLFMNIATDGPAEALTEDARHAVQEVVNVVNRDGGICGRTLSVKMVRGWHEPPDNTFAILVGPLKTEFDDEIRNGIVARRRIPVVGTDGLTTVQSQSPWVWPVGTSLARQARIAVDHAYHRDGARTFAMVHDGTPAALEAAAAFQEHVERLGGAQVRVVHRVDGPARAYNTACNEGRCDAVVLAVSPGGFSDWRSNWPPTARLRTAGLSTMLDKSVSNECAAPLAPDGCSNLRIWTPYTPALPAFLADRAVNAYAVAPSDDVNPLSEGAYVGALTLVEALKKISPNITRERLRQALSSMQYDSGLVDLLQWRPGNHAGNVSARAIAVRDGSFVDAGTGWVRDPLSGSR